MARWVHVFSQSPFTKLGQETTFFGLILLLVYQYSFWLGFICASLFSCVYDKVASLLICCYYFIANGIMWIQSITFHSRLKIHLEVGTGVFSLNILIGWTEFFVLVSSFFIYFCFRLHVPIKLITLSFLVHVKLLYCIVSYHTQVQRRFHATALHDDSVAVVQWTVRRHRLATISVFLTRV